MRQFIKLHCETKRIINGKVVEDFMINSEWIIIRREYKESFQIKVF